MCITDDTTTTNHNYKNKTNDAICQELERLSARHGQSKTRMKNMLRPRHADEEFNSNDNDYLFDRFARAVCQCDCVWRKELLEAWAVALFVHAHFPDNVSRLVDCASGHGLLAWAILVLQLLDGKEEEEEPRKVLTAICVDVNMPKAADIVAAAMVEHFPQLASCVDYVEAKLETIIPSSTTLIVGVHCCALLSDKVVTLALLANAPLILVPCCHSKKSLRETGEKDLLKTKGFNVADYIDQKRMRNLRDARFDVQDAIIPCVIPPKNRIIIAIPPTATMTSDTNNCTATATTCQLCTTPTQAQSLQYAAEYYLTAEQSTTTSTTTSSLSALPPLIEPDRISWIPSKQRIAIPVADTPQDKAQVKILAGREASHERLKPPPPSIGFSMFLPPEQLESVTAEVISALFAPLYNNNSNNNNTDVESTGRIRVEDKQLRKRPVPAKYEKITKTFNIHYPDDMDLEQAKEIHRQAFERLPLVVEGAVPRNTLSKKEKKKTNRIECVKPPKVLGAP